MIVCLALLGVAPAAVALSSIRTLAASEQTTEMARDLLLEKIREIEGCPDCRRSMASTGIDVALLKTAAQRTRFYSAEGPEGRLNFSAIVGRPASPDSTVRALAQELTDRDAFVLGYFLDGAYVRSNAVVLSRGFFERPAAGNGIATPTTKEQRQALLLHEILHIVLDKDDRELKKLVATGGHGLARCLLPVPKSKMPHVT